MHDTERSQTEEPSEGRPAPHREVNAAALIALAFDVWAFLVAFVRALPGEVRSAHQHNVERAVADRLRQLDELSALDGTRDRIRPVVKSAEELLAAREWESTFIRLPHLRFPILGALQVGFLAMSAVVLIVGVGNLGLTGDTLANAFVLCGCALTLRAIVHALVWRRLRPLVTVLTAAGLIGATLRMEWWSGPVLGLLNDLERSSSGNSLRGVDWPAALHGGVWLAAVAAVLGLVPPASRFVYQRVVEASTYRKSSPVIQTALLLDEFLDIAHRLEQMVRDDDHHTIAYLTNRDRLVLVTALDQLAERVRGPWAKAVRTGHGAVDGQLADLADGIAAAILRWQLRAAQGSRPLTDMRDAFALAVVNICDGDWQLMAAEDIGAKESRKRRAAAVVKRIVLIPVPLLISLVIVKYVPGVPERYDTPIVLAGAATSAVYLLTTLDAKFSEALAAAGSLTQAIRK